MVDTATSMVPCDPTTPDPREQDGESAILNGMSNVSLSNTEMWNISRKFEEKRASLEEDLIGKSTEELLAILARERSLRDQYTLQVEMNNVEISRLQKQHAELGALLRAQKRALFERMQQNQMPLLSEEDGGEEDGPLTSES